MTAAYALWASAAMQIRFTFATAAAMVVGVVQPIAFIGIGLIGRTDQSAGSTGQVIVGGALLSLWSSTLWAAGSVLRREAYAGTLSAIISRPTPLFVVLLGKTLGASVAAAGMIAASTAGVSLVLRSRPAFGAPGIFVLIVVLSVLSSALLGVIVSCLTLLTRAAPRVIEALMYPVFVLGGLIIPLSELPQLLQYPSTLITFRWAVEVMTGQAAHPVPALFVLGLLTGLYAVGAVVTTSLVLNRALREATLDLT